MSGQQPRASACSRIWLWATLWKVPSSVTGDWSTQVQSAPEVKCLVKFHSDSACLTWTSQPFNRRTAPPQQEWPMSYAKGGTTKSFNFPCTDSSVNERGNSAAASQQRELNNSSALQALLFSQHVQGLTELFQSTNWKLWKNGVSLENVSSTKSNGIWEEKAILDYCRKS